MLTMKTTVNNGLPCIAQVTFYSPEEDPAYDYEGTCGEIEFSLKIRKDKPAPWIHKAASAGDLETVAHELTTRFKEAARVRSY